MRLKRPTWPLYDRRDLPATMCLAHPCPLQVVSPRASLCFSRSTLSRVDALDNYSVLYGVSLLTLAL